MVLPLSIAAILSPDGNVSMKLMPVICTLLAGFVKVIVSVLVAPAMTLVGKNALINEGVTAFVVSVADAAMPV